MPLQVFISWSGAMAREIAGVLHEHMPSVIQALRPWMSDADLKSGDRWSSMVGEHLEKCTIGLCVVTTDNKDAPWLMFEAGALSKSVENNRLIPLLFGMKASDLAGPLSQFQAKQGNVKKDLFDVFQTINGSLSEQQQLPLPRLTRAFESTWDHLGPALEAILAKGPPAARQESHRPEREILDEMWQMLKGLSGVDMLGKRSWGALRPLYPPVGAGPAPSMASDPELDALLGNASSEPVK